MLFRFVIAFLPRSKCLLISWLQSSSAVILEPPNISVTLFPLFPHLFATEAEYTKKRWQEYTEELYKKDLHDPDNQDGVIIT